MQNARILIIDYDESVRKVMQTILEDEAIALKQRKQLKKGLTKSEKKYYHLALLDVHCQTWKA